MSIPSDPSWLLTDNLRPVPYRQGGEEVPIYSVEQLAEALRSFVDQKPRMLILDKANGPQLFIGIAGQWAGVSAYPNPPTGRSWSATPAVLYSSEDLWVTSEGEPSRVRAACVMPVEEVIEIVAHAVEHGDLPDTVAWINLKGERLR